MARILIVDDDPLVLALLQRALEKAGHEVVSADNGRVALARFEADPTFHAVITDIQMPEVDGLEVIRALRQRAEPPRIIALTSRSGPDAYLRAAKLFGADRALVKPKEWDRVLASLHELLEGS